MSSRSTVLFVADAVTLAHVARPAALAQALDPARFNVVLASDPRYQRFLAGLPFPVRSIHSQPSERFLRAAAKGSPLYDTQTLRDYVKEDLALLDSVQPDAVVGDHRLSLSVSARVAKVPYLCIINAYWSPYTQLVSPVPELPVTRWLGTTASQTFFNFVRPLAFAYHSLPLNRVRHDYGLPAMGWDWRRPYTDADRTLYADARELVPTRGLPASHSYLGPVSWSPAVAMPPWWDDLTTDRPLIYVSLGSSGHPGLLGRVLDALAGMPVNVVATTAGRAEVGSPPANARLLDYAQGDKLMERADLMICNGGSLTAYQALAAGKPLVGIAAHMDQHLSMHFVEEAGVGIKIRAEQLDKTSLRTATQRLLQDGPARQRAIAMAHAITAYSPAQRLAQILDEVTIHDPD